MAVFHGYESARYLHCIVGNEHTIPLRICKP